MLVAKTPSGSVTFSQISKELVTLVALKSYSIKAIEIWYSMESTYNDIVLGLAKQEVSLQKIVESLLT